MSHDHGDLELYSTQDLIDEMMRRTTFQGVIVRADQDAKSPGWDGERVFRVHFNGNLDVEEACRLLSTVSAHMDGLSA